MTADDDPDDVDVDVEIEASVKMHVSIALDRLPPEIFPFLYVGLVQVQVSIRPDLVLVGI